MKTIANLVSSRLFVWVHRMAKAYLLTLVMHKISSPGAYRAVYKALHGVFTGLSLVTLSEIQKK